MISRSASETPAIRGGSFTPGPSHMNSSITWVKDWYIPEITNTSFQNNGGSFEPQSIKLKGWHRTSVDSNNNPAVKFDSDDTLDLNNWKYYKVVAITNHSEDEGVAENSNGEGDIASKDELSSALSIKNKDEEIVSLSGITDT
ncbi:uncharacterized protein AC631_04876 [Debaryomyces fabryi]|uniref:Uncharacterized protein n=1 Tax=Debaryomyces fabryi TaxID=58627 RepID=A0A0V1PT81_9ASCO|nr:uncharacterized protein AC631_04876 [Debaryomyces fabryi]KRZ99362.1 hypothetical protein AC631_04876 [Debaryomyces fabryi]CUM53171.1 unnamed protein product [Debaryomyces fabryi]